MRRQSNQWHTELSPARENRPPILPIPLNAAPAKSTAALLAAER